MFPVEIRSGRILLRELREDDFPAVHRYGGDPEVARYTIWGPDDPEQSREFLAAAMAAARSEERREYEFGIEMAGELVGGARIGIKSTVHRLGDIGYVVRRDLWGRGIASEAAMLLLRLGFLSLDLHRVEATCDPKNAGSRRVLERIGMRFEGHLRENVFAHTGWRDSLLFAMLRADWAALDAQD
ncbi:MAG: GNAT family protein [Thermaerobacter sp.]|nr:GNAT family protein [Thermaerobacter sp.]